MKAYFLIAGLLLGATALPSAEPKSDAAAAFTRLKTLVGEWEAKTSMGQAHLSYELTAGGSALVERESMENMPGMLTVFTLDGDRLLLTHYCMAGNQPTMHASYAPDAKTLTFDFESASNLKSPNDGHMHNAVYTFLDNDHFKTRWTFQKDQKDAFTEEVTYVRVK